MNTKDKLIATLKKNRGSWISGEQLSREFTISRAAVNKHIRNLRKAGYEIASTTNKGYCLEGGSNLLLENEIKEGLETKSFGRHEIIVLSETDSTNTRAKDLAAQGAPEGTLVLAERQTQGRGRKGRSWLSPTGSGIYSSLILRPRIPPSEAPVITLLTAVVVAETLKSLTPLTPKIKWPNDILINGKKIAGILTEMSMEIDAVDFIIVGLGLNVNTPADGFTKELQGIATSIFIETQKRWDRTALVREYLKQYEIYYDLFKRDGFSPIVKRWKALTDIIGREVRVDMVNKTIDGRVTDVDNDGVLILKDNAGEFHRIYSGDVIFQ